MRPSNFYERGFDMAVKYKKFDLYYLGVSTSTTPLTFRNASFIKQIIVPLFDTDIMMLNLRLGTTSSTGDITLNADGIAYNDIIPFASRGVVGFKTSSQAGHAALDNVKTQAANYIYDLNDFMTPPTSTANYYWFAIANNNAYAPFYVHYESREITPLPGLLYGHNIGTSGGIKYKLDDTAIADTSATHVIPVNSYSHSNSNAYYFESKIIVEYQDDYYYQYLYVQYPYGSGNQQLGVAQRTNYKLTDNEKLFIDDASNYIPPPYDGGGTSTVNEGGTGTFDATSDTITAPTVPTLTVADTGFVRIYNPTLSQLKSLAQYMWTDPNFLTTLLNQAKQLLENPIESIISLNLLPCSIPNSADEEVKVLFIPTGVYMPPATTQFVEVNCGTLEVKEYYGSALDYSPYTKIHCYLPYIGQVTLDTDEVMGKTLDIKYRIDIVTGMCVAIISVNGTVMYQFSGHCAIAMPLTSADFSSYIGAAISVGKAVGAVVAAGAGAPQISAGLVGTNAPSTTTTTFDSTSTVRNPASGRQVKAGTEHSEKTVSSKGSSFGEIATKAASNTVGAVMGSKTVVEHSGGFTGNSGYLAVRRPYLIIEIPRMCNPAEYGTFNGYPSMITTQLSECEGFTSVQNIQLKGFSATREELSEIAELLMGGVIF